MTFRRRRGIEHMSATILINQALQSSFVNVSGPEAATVYDILREHGVRSDT